MRTGIARQELAAEAEAQADAALGTAGLTVRELDRMDELQALSDLIDRVWRRDTPMIEQGLLRAFAEAGGYVVGAFVSGDLVGGAVAFLGRHDGRDILHSHVAGFVDAEAGRGRGRALKLHQRSWCLARGIDLATWTFDPLVRRNAWFNLQRLGVVAARYESNYYGSLRDDAINGSDESDRFVAHWHLLAPAVRQLAGGSRIEPDHDLLAAAGAVDLIDDTGRPTDRTGSTAFVLVPDDIVALRGSDPSAAARWRRATRDALVPRLAAGDRITGFTRTGRYVVAP
jgi:predicted GNAT superfamily acetyltransferase